MSGHRIHILVYGLTAIAVTYILARLEFIEGFSLSLLPAWVLGLFYSLLPDIDQPASKTRELLSKLLLAAALVSLLYFAFIEQSTLLLYVSIAVIVFLYLLWFTKHRGIFHTVYAAVILSLPFYVLNPLYGIYAFAGFASHLLVDGKIL
jgi:hypothetical protein